MTHRGRTKSNDHAHIMAIFEEDLSGLTPFYNDVAHNNV